MQKILIAFSALLLSSSYASTPEPLANQPYHPINPPMNPGAPAGLQTPGAVVPPMDGAAPNAGINPEGTPPEGGEVQEKGKWDKFTESVDDAIDSAKNLGKKALDVTGRGLAAAGKKALEVGGEAFDFADRGMQANFDDMEDGFQNLVECRESSAISINKKIYNGELLNQQEERVIRNCINSRNKNNVNSANPNYVYTLAAGAYCLAPDNGQEPEAQRNTRQENCRQIRYLAKNDWLEGYEVGSGVSGSGAYCSANDNDYNMYVSARNIADSVADPQQKAEAHKAVKLAKRKMRACMREEATMSKKAAHPAYRSRIYGNCVGTQNPDGFDKDICDELRLTLKDWYRDSKGWQYMKTESTPITAQ